MYFYTDGLLTQLDYQGGYYKFEYINGQPVKRKLYVGPAIKPDYDNLIYNTNGTLARIDFYEYGQPDNYFLYGKIIFTYNTEQLEKIEIYSVSGNVSTLEEDYTYTSHSGNIVMCRAADYLPTFQVANFNYTYDNSLNYFKKQNLYGYILDPLFIDTDGILLPFAMSKNNVTNVEINGVNTPYSYQLNSKQDLFVFHWETPIHHNIVFEYNCN